MTNPSFTAFLTPSEFIDSDHPTIVAQAQSLTQPDITATAKATFEWVRDHVLHSRDHEKNPVTCRASDVLKHRTGYCYAKSHLLAALLRVNNIPAGLCYQRLSVNDTGAPYCLHGFNAIHLPTFGWYRVDPRGNRPGINARFAPPAHHLAFPLQTPDEYEFETILPEPLPCITHLLTTAPDWQSALANLPDISPDQFPQHHLTIRLRGLHYYP